MKSLSIKQKLLFSLLVTVLVATSAVSLVSIRSTGSALQQRLVEKDIPASLNSIRDQLQTEVEQLGRVAQQLATSERYQAWVKAGKNPEGEAALVRDLQQITEVYQLQAASFCDRTTGDYWNEKGFLRRLDPNSADDSWFGAFKDSGRAHQASIYKSATVGYQLFVNYQEVGGMGLSGVARSMTAMVESLQRFKIEQTGFVFLVNRDGQVQVHPSAEPGTALQTLLPAASLSSLIGKDSLQLFETEVAGEDTVLASVYVPGLDWWLVAQVPREEVFAVLHEAERDLLFSVLIILVILLVLAIQLSNSITKPIQNLSRVFAELGQGSATLDVRLAAEGGTELAELTQGFNQFVEKISRLVMSIRQSGEELQQQAATLAEQARASFAQNQQQLTSSNLVSEAIRQMEQTVLEIADNAGRAAQNTRNASERGRDGQQHVEQAQQQMKRLISQVTDAGTVISQLAAHSENINQILNVIRSVADQTNLLALNAAIEAARAGEHGRGFSVVADEVRQLAARTGHSASEIQQLITELGHQIQSAVQTVHVSANVAAEGAQSSQLLADQLHQISGDVNSLESMNIQIAAATEEQSVVASDLHQQLVRMTNITEQNVETAEQLLTTSEQLRQLSQQLAQLSSQFGR